MDLLVSQTKQKSHFNHLSSKKLAQNAIQTIYWCKVEKNDVILTKKN